MEVQQVTPIACPSCKARFNAPFYNIINGENQPIKVAFLQGRLNVVQCPQCRVVFPIQVPILYYDLKKELAFSYVPGGLNVAMDAQEKVIGNLTNALVKQLKPEEQRFYLLNPKRFLQLESMFDAIFEADGVTKEMRAAQRTKLELVHEFLQIESEADLRKKTKEHSAKIDRDFFEILTSMMQAASAEGDQSLVQGLVVVRQVIAEETTDGGKWIDEIDAERGLFILRNRADLLQRLQTTNDNQEFLSLIATGHHMLDYQFFQELTAEIDNTDDQEQAKRLKELRAKIMHVKNALEEESRKAFKNSQELLKEILQSNDPEKVIAENIENIDQSFFTILTGHLQHAEQTKQTQTVQTMQRILEMTISQFQQRQAKLEEAPKKKESEIQIAKK
jgi:hypothetical protein